MLGGERRSGIGSRNIRLPKMEVNFRSHMAGQDWQRHNHSLRSIVCPILDFLVSGLCCSEEMNLNHSRQIKVDAVRPKAITTTKICAKFCLGIAAA